MAKFATTHVTAADREPAPDGSQVGPLLRLEGGSMAHFELAPGRTSTAIKHRSVEEIWVFVSGRGEMWRRLGPQEEVVPVQPGVCVTIPRGTHFQFRCLGGEALGAIAITMPPWPGDDEAVRVEGQWKPTAPP